MTEKAVIEVLNQLFEIEKKKNQFQFERIDRNLDRLVWLFEQEGYTYQDPTGELYNETRTDCQATFLSENEPFVIKETIKPIILKTEDGVSTIVQQARVIIN